MATSSIVMRFFLPLLKPGVVFLPLSIFFILLISAIKHMDGGERGLDGGERGGLHAGERGPVLDGGERGGLHAGERGAQLSILGYQTTIIHFIQCFMEISIFLVPEG